MSDITLEKPKRCIYCNKTENEIRCHPFPQDMDMAMKWSKSVVSNDNIPVPLLQSKYVVCRDHFCDDDYDMKLNFIAGDGTVFKTGFQLNSTAVPKPYMDEHKAYVTKTNKEGKTKKKQSPVKAPPESNRKSQLTIMMQNLFYGKQQNVKNDKENNEHENTQHEIISKFNVRSLADLEIKCSGESSPGCGSPSTEEMLGMSIPKPISDSQVRPPSRPFSPQPIMNCDSKEMFLDILNNSNNATTYVIRDDKWIDTCEGKEDAYMKSIKGYSEDSEDDDAVQAVIGDANKSFNADESNSELYKKLCEYAVRVEELETTVQRYRKSHVVLSKQVAIMRRELKLLGADQSERS